MISKRKRTGILVFGHTRPVHLKNVLESLRRQKAGRDIHVWLDGHMDKPSLISKVEKCRKFVEEQFPEMLLTAINGNIGIEKLTLDGLSFMCERYERIIILEDDCFPTASAVSAFEDTLDEITKRPEVYSVYGHHFLTPSEGETITRFQGWGWATTTKKLLTILPDLKKCFYMSEHNYLKWVAENMSRDIRNRLDVTPGRDCVDVMSKYFCWDSCTCLLTAQRGLIHKKTPERVIYNCGMEEGGGHFSENDGFRQPPFNMITVDEVWNYFDDKNEPVHAGVA